MASAICFDGGRLSVFTSRLPSASVFAKGVYQQHRPLTLAAVTAVFAMVMAPLFAMVASPERATEFHLALSATRILPFGGSGCSKCCSIYFGNGWGFWVCFRKDLLRLHLRAMYLKWWCLQRQSAFPCYRL